MKDRPQQQWYWKSYWGAVGAFNGGGSGPEMGLRPTVKDDPQITQIYTDLKLQRQKDQREEAKKSLWSEKSVDWIRRLQPLVLDALDPNLDVKTF